MPRFTTIGLRKMTTPGRYGDGVGSGLWLQVRTPENRSWLFRFTFDGRSRDMGLGPLDTVSLAEARDMAAAARRLVRDGIDPIAHRRTAKEERWAALQAATFTECAALYVEAHAAGWRNAKHGAQWMATLDAYAFPVFGSVPVASVVTAHVLRALEPIWREKPETASRVRGRIEAILDYAKSRGWRTGENPARWKGHLANLLPSRAKLAPVQHHAALPWPEMPAFMTALRAQSGTAAQALQFAILTGARTGEAIGATWGEVDLGGAAWTIPGQRMKGAREHRVPLSGPALAILGARHATRLDDRATAFVFPGGREGRPLSGMAMTALLRRMGRGDITVHGFRSTFRDWASEATSYPREVAEAALAHAVRDKVEAAYRRGDLFEKRRAMLAEWAVFCGYPATGAGRRETASATAGAT